jgi:hypothetical protein
MKLADKLLKSYHAYYYKNRKPPTSISIGYQYRDEFLMTIGELKFNEKFITTGQSFFAGLPINWTRRARIECLPRQNKNTLKWGRYPYFGIPHSYLTTTPVRSALKITTI